MAVAVAKATKRLMFLDELVTESALQAQACITKATLSRAILVLHVSHCQCLSCIPRLKSELLEMLRLWSRETLYLIHEVKRSVAEIFVTP
jgi:hypothetical protein